MTEPIDPADDIWNLLPDYYPRRQDRDALVARAQSDPEGHRRVRIWDFFFPIEKGKLLAPLLREKANLLAEQSRLGEELSRDEIRIPQELAHLRKSASRAKAEWEHWSVGIHSQMSQAIEKKVALLLSVGVGILIVSGLAALVLVAAATNEDSFGGFMAGCAAPMLVVPTIVGGVLIVFACIILDSLEQKVEEAQDREHGQLADHLNELREKDDSLVSLLASKRTYVTSRVPEIKKEILTLDARVVLRESQIPEPPTIDQAYRWFAEELDDLREEILLDSGKEGDLVKPNLARNKFCLRGPAELQAREQIEEVYLTDPDLLKHLTAKRAGVDCNGKTVDLYGVSIIEFLFLGNHDFTSARVFFDFITKRKVVKLRTHPYNAVALVESGSHFRKVSILRNGALEPEVIDDAPSISFTLENGQRIDVSFANKSYLREAFPELDAHNRAYDDWEHAKAAIKLLRNKVHEARLQAGSQSEGGSGPLSQKLDDLGDPCPNPPPS